MMAPAVWPRGEPLAERLLVVDPATGLLEHKRIADLPSLVAPGDVWVLNDSATVPASLSGTLGDVPIEIRLLARDDDTTYRAVVFGAGDWRSRTEDRPPPPPIAPGAVARFGTLEASLFPTDTHPRLVRARFKGADIIASLFRIGKPVQYSYLREVLPLWHVESAFASRPWSFEMPSAGRPLSWSTLLALRERGATLARVSHAAGLSSTGDPSLDALLPLDERYEIPEETVTAIRRGGRVIAVGTTVVRALEGSELRPGKGVTSLRIGPGFRPKVVTGLLTGMHEPGTSHAALMNAFAPAALLDRAWREAESMGYLGHEFGDSTLVLPTARGSRP